jgi:hypothetical protein
MAMRERLAQTEKVNTTQVHVSLGVTTKLKSRLSQGRGMEMRNWECGVRNGRISGKERLRERIVG